MAKNNTTSLDTALNEAAKDISSATTPVVGATVDTVEANAARAYNALEAKRKSLVTIYRNEKKVPVTISPFYAPYLGKVVRQSVNGIIVDVPADGRTYMINKTHADQLVSKIKRINSSLRRIIKKGQRPDAATR